MNNFKFKDLMVTISDPLAKNACFEKSDVCPQPSSPTCRGQEEVSCQSPSNVEADNVKCVHPSKTKVESKANDDLYPDTLHQLKAQIRLLHQKMNASF